MSEIVNLRRERRRRARAEARKAADANAARHGRARHERLQETAERARDDRTHEGHRLNDGEE